MCRKFAFGGKCGNQICCKVHYTNKKYCSAALLGWACRDPACLREHLGVPKSLIATIEDNAHNSIDSNDIDGTSVVYKSFYKKASGDDSSVRKCTKYLHTLLSIQDMRNAEPLGADSDKFDRIVHGSSDRNSSPSVPPAPPSSPRTNRLSRSSQSSRSSRS